MQKHYATFKTKEYKKSFMTTHKIPTAPFSVFETIAQVKKAVASGELKLPFVWKSCTGGYDGKGVQVIKNSHIHRFIARLPLYSRRASCF